MSGNIGVKKVQELFGLKVDGIVGSKTLGKINSVDGEWLFKRIWEMSPFLFSFGVLYYLKVNFQIGGCRR